MTTRHRLLRTACALLLSGCPIASLHAQAPAQPAVRRAQPVATPTPPNRFPTNPNLVDNPAWMLRVAPAQGVAPTPTPEPAPTPAPQPTPPQIRRAEPVATPYRPPGFETPPILYPPSPAPTPTPSPSPILPSPEPPAPTPAATPAATPPPNQPPSERTDVLPGEQAELQKPRRIQTEKDFGDAFYARKMYDTAIVEYEKFLAATPSSPERVAALFRLAESYRIKDNKDAARMNYERLLREARTGEFVGAAAYRLGSIFLDSDMPGVAAGHFETAKREATDEAIRTSAAFFAARGNELSGQNRAALRLYQELLEKPGLDSRYRDSSLAAMARLSEALGRRTDAISFYRRLSETTADPKLQTEALVKSANLLIGEKKFDEARAILAGIATREDAGEWAGAAAFALIELDYASSKFDDVAALSDTELNRLPAASRPRALLLAANANRQLGRFPEALLRYDAIRTSAPDSDAAKEARFHRLVCLSRMDDPGLLDALNTFLIEAREPSQIAHARMLKAETHFAKGQFADAAVTYGSLTHSDLPENLLSDAAYKHAWSLAKSGNSRDAVIAYSDFIERFPNDPRLGAALVARAMGHAESGTPDAALRDFDRAIQNYPEQKEIALLQRALLHGASRDYPQMQKDFESLVTQFPDSAARAQAEFWIAYAKFENKDYEGSIPHFEESRKRDPQTYGERANTRLMLANYYLERPEAAAAEIENHAIKNVPAEVYQWLAAKFLEQDNLPMAEKYLRVILEGRAGSSPTPELYLQLGKNQLAQKKFADALDPLSKFVEATRDPAPRARGLLAQAEAHIGLRQFDDANKLIEDAQLLQPEGRVNADARMLLARLLEERGSPEEAAKAYMTVALLYEDEIITPRALKSAAAAFEKTGNSAEARRALDDLERRFPDHSDSPSSEAATR